MCYGQEIDRQTVLCYHQDVAVAGMARRNHHWRNNLPFWLSGESGYTTSASICLCLCRSVNMFWEISFGLVAEGESGSKRNFRSFSFHRVVDGRKKVRLKAGLFLRKNTTWAKSHPQRRNWIRLSYIFSVFYHRFVSSWIDAHSSFTPLEREKKRRKQRFKDGKIEKKGEKVGP